MLILIGAAVAIASAFALIAMAACRAAGMADRHAEELYQDD